MQLNIEMLELARALEKHAAVLRENTIELRKQKAGGVGAGGGGAAGTGGPAGQARGGKPAGKRGGTGGLLGRLGGLGGLARAVPGFAAAAAGSAIAGTAASAVSSGLIQAGRGGDFGSGAARALSQVAAKIPFVGEYFGSAPLERTLQGTEGDLNATTNTVARILGPNALDSQTRSFIARRRAVENRNVELDRQANSTITNQVAPLAAQGLGAGAEAISIGLRMNHLLSAAGLQQNQ